MGTYNTPAKTVEKLNVPRSHHKVVSQKVKSGQKKVFAKKWYLIGLRSFQKRFINFSEIENSGKAGAVKIGYWACMG